MTVYQASPISSPGPARGRRRACFARLSPGLLLFKVDHRLRHPRHGRWYWRAVCDGCEPLPRDEVLAGFERRMAVECPGVRRVAPPDDAA